MRRVLVIGRKGQLARSLAERGSRYGVDLLFRGRPSVDLAQPESLREAVLSGGAAVVVNAAAYTSVDEAEDEPAVARALNVEGPRVLAEAVRTSGARLVHISTDYVFGGAGDRPWRETDPTSPMGVYGRTKLDGEEAIRATGANHVIIRTAWVYSPFGRNFVKTMLALAQTRPQLKVVGDQIGNPTSALDLADGILTMIDRWQLDPSLGLGTTFHLAGAGCASWAEFAREIFRLSAERGGPSAVIEAIRGAEWPSRAARPLNSRLDSCLFEQTFEYRTPVWQQSLANVVDRIVRR